MEGSLYTEVQGSKLNKFDHVWGGGGSLNVQCIRSNGRMGPLWTGRHTTYDITLTIPLAAVTKGYKSTNGITAHRFPDS